MMTTEERRTRPERVLARSHLGAVGPELRIDPYPSVRLGGGQTHLLDFDEAIDAISRRATHPGVKPLAVASVNLDHIHHFGTGSTALQTFGHPVALARELDSSVEWLNLIDGAPVAAQARRLTGKSWPRLAGSDLIAALLDRAERENICIGFLGGTAATHDKLRECLALTRPKLRVAGFWSPSRDEVTDAVRSAGIAHSISEAGVEMLIVGLGKPRQELWIAQHGARTGARVLLAFGAVVDFLAGQAVRAPQPIVDAGLEWAWRLMLEPRRMARRYLLQGPRAYLALRSSLRGKPQQQLPAEGFRAAARDHESADLRPKGRFVKAEEHADVAVVVVTYNNEDSIGPLLRSLHEEAASTRIRVVVVDNDSTDRTLAALADEHDVKVIKSGGNVGYAGGINVARRHLSHARAVLVLNPDLVVRPGSIRAMLARMESSGAGIVVPAFVDGTGRAYPSIRREPVLPAAVMGAVFGRWLSRRPDLPSEIDYRPESYRVAHKIDWATGAALLVQRELADKLGDWDERFFLYSEETDYFKRAREAGATVWFEPLASVKHEQGGSGSSDDQVALMAVNRIRYAEKHGSPAHRRAMHAAVVLHEALRSFKKQHRHALRFILNRNSWSQLPKAAVPAKLALAPTATPSPRPARPARRESFARGAIIIPAHNEQAVIGRTLSRLAPLAASGRVEVIVCCNGCTDETARVARSFNGVRVIVIEEASKVAALNAGDDAAVTWPRLYLDADIEISVEAVDQVFRALTTGTLHAARPAFQYETSGANALVKRYYRARARIPSANSSLWGAGAYALSSSGHARLGKFPQVTADDLWIDHLFRGSDRMILDTPAVLVRTPRNIDGLMAVLRRTYRGNSEMGLPSTAPSSLRELAASVRCASSALDAVVYVAFALAARLAAWGRPKGQQQQHWERDESSRTQPVSQLHRASEAS